jgi:hypothetical protein
MASFFFLSSDHIRRHVTQETTRTGERAALLWSVRCHLRRNDDDVGCCWMGREKKEGGRGEPPTPPPPPPPTLSQSGRVEGYAEVIGERRQLLCSFSNADEDFGHDSYVCSHISNRLKDRRQCSRPLKVSFPSSSSLGKKTNDEL